MSKLIDAVIGLENEAIHNEKTAREFLVKNEALRAENDRLRKVCHTFQGERNDAQQCAADYFRAMALLHERDANDERDLLTILRALLAELDALRAEVASLNRYFAVGVKLTGEVQALRTELCALRTEYANRGAILQDFAKREHAHQEKIAELEKILKQFFPPPDLPEPWETDSLAIPQGEWVLRSNEALRNRVCALEAEIKRLGVLLDALNPVSQDVAELRNMCALLRDAATVAHKNAIRLRQERDEALATLAEAQGSVFRWQQREKHQTAINARQRARLAELRLQLQRLTIERIGGTGTMAAMAAAALIADDYAAAQLMQEAE